MSDYLVTSTELTETADAIRAKTGDSNAIEWESGTGFADAVAAIPSGGGVIDPDADVIFIDFDGTILYSYSLDEINQLTELPPAPDHSNYKVPLVFQSWNWTLQQIKDRNLPCEVGATYTTSDGEMHFFVRILSLTDATVSLYGRIFQNSTVDWGDGSTSTVGADYYATVSHTYSAIGEYHCIYTCNSSGRTGLWGFSGGTAHLVTEVYTGNHVVKPSQIAQNDVFGFGIFVLAEGVAGFSNGDFKQSVMLKALVLPRTCAGTAIVSSTFASARSLRYVSFPTNITIGNVSTLNGCWSLKRATISLGTAGGYDKLTSCYALESFIFDDDAVSSGAFLLTNARSLSKIRFTRTTPTVFSSSNVLTSVSPGLVVIFPYTVTDYLTATNYPSPSTYLYLGFHKSSANEALPTTAGAKTLTWYPSIEEARSQINAITLGNGKEVYCRYA